MSIDETTIWEGGPSHRAHGITYAAGVVFSFVVIPAIIALKRALSVYGTEYTVTDERILVKEGLLSTKEEQLELYRVKDIRREQPFLLGLHDLVNLEVITSDPSHPSLTLEAVPGDIDLRDRIREAVEMRRDEKGVKEVDYH
jgi:uncharacterized membrane protein YdbT with pleckstrin-like domain